MATIVTRFDSKCMTCSSAVPAGSKVEYFNKITKCPLCATAGREYEGEDELWALGALRVLLGKCDGAKTHDSKGFSRYHADEARGLYEKVKRDGKLFAGEWRRLVWFANHYRKQLPQARPAGFTVLVGFYQMERPCPAMQAAAVVLQQGANALGAATAPEVEGRAV